MQQIEIAKYEAAVTKAVWETFDELGAEAFLATSLFSSNEKQALKKAA